MTQTHAEVGEQLLASLDPEQRQVALALSGPVRVLAGAGTGKTRAITHRIAYGVATGVYAPTEVLALSFTTRAAGEMRGRLQQLGAVGVQARTFHSAALRQLRYFWPQTYGSALPSIVESKLSLVAQAAKRLALPTDASTLKDLAAAIEWSKVSNLTPDRYAERAGALGQQVAGLEPDLVARAFAAYETIKRDAGRIDLEDVLLLTAALLADEPAVAAKVQAQYRWFVVDEFQDASPAQAKLLDLWLGTRKELCVVGDPAQTIFSFAGADANLLLNFPVKFAHTTTIELTRNYRSTPQIVSFANQVLAGVQPKALQLAAQSPAGREVIVTSYPDEVAEADAVAEQIKALLAQGTATSEVAVLVRINAQTEALEEALAAREISYAVRGGARFFDRPEIKEVFTRLRGIARSQPDLAIPEALDAALAAMGWHATAPTVRGQSRDRWESLDSFRAMVSVIEGDLGGLIAELDRRAADQHDPDPSGVTLATMHAAKGLEWPVVFVVGLTDGTVPISYAETLPEIAEEGRLLYVALTRAQRELRLSWATARNPGGRAVREPSRFLPRAVKSAAGASSRRPARAQRRSINCASCGAALRSGAEKKLGRCANCPVDYNEELFSTLREWRKQRAEADKVPAYVVFTDATLMLIAQAEPVSPSQLLAVHGVGAGKLEKYADEVLALITPAKSNRIK